MHLSEFIRANTEQILREWEDFARKLAGEVSLPKWLLRDHANSIIGQIATAVETSEADRRGGDRPNDQSSTDAAKYPTPAHVELRIESGFDLLQIMAEYFALRACVLRLWRNADPSSFTNGADEITRFAQVIDDQVAAAVSYYKTREMQYRDRFLGILGHDLRNPLNAIILSATSLAPDASSEQQSRSVSRILSSAHRLSGMVTDLLDFARGRLGSPMPITPAPTDLGTLVREIVGEVQSTNPGSPIVFESSGDLAGNWDIDRFKQVIANLLLNAIKHGSGQTVTISARSDNDQVSLEVHNQGSPISPELLPTIFDPLVRGGDPAHNDTSLGLGLFIVSEIVAAHHGTVTVTSTEDAGTSFTVRLPRKSS